MTEPIPVTLLCGYLGAGKTTLINSLLRQCRDRVIGVLVNDLGELQIDASLIDNQQGRTITLTNGCICCSLADGFDAALAEIGALVPAVDHLLIEASGVAEPGGIKGWLHPPGFSLTSVATVVDCTHILERLNSPYVADLVTQQLEQADLLILTHLGTCPDLQQVQMALGNLSMAPQHLSWDSSIDSALLLDPPRSPPRQRGMNEEAPSTQGLPPHAQHYAAVREFRDSLSRIRLLEALQTRPSGVVRVKGILLLDEDATHEPPTRASKGFHEINCSADEVTLRPIIHSVGPSQIVAISDGSISPEKTEEWLSDTVSFCTVSGTSGHSTELSSPST